MAWNGAGTFSRTNGGNSGATTWQLDAAADLNIEADRHDTHDQDLAAGINACLAKNGENAMTGDLAMGGNDILNAGAIAATSLTSSGAVSAASLTVNSVSITGAPYYERTASEIAAGVTPTAYQYEPGNVLRYGANTTPGTTDMTAAIQAAIDANLVVTIPDGIYLVSSQLETRDGSVLRGDGPVETAGARGAKLRITGAVGIYTGASRVSITLDNLWLVDETNAGAGLTATGLSGSFGGQITGCRFDDFAIAINNPLGYVCEYENNVFENNDRGIVSDNTNSVNILRNIFSRGRIYVETGADAAGVLFEGNTFNIAPETTEAIICAGLTTIRSNYFEAFTSATPAGSSMVRYETSSDEQKGLTVCGNIMNGQGFMDYAVVIAPATTLVTQIRGEIRHNYIGTFTTAAFSFDTYNNVTGLDISDNRGLATLENVGLPYKPIIRSSLSTTTSVAGATFINLPIGEVTEEGNCAPFTDSGTKFNAPKTGYYRISGSITFVSTGADYTAIEYRVARQGVSLGFHLTSIKWISGSTYMAAGFDETTYLSKGNQIQVQSRNGESVAKLRFNAEWLRESSGF